MVSQIWAMVVKLTWMASMAPMASMASMVPEAVTALLAPKLTFGTLQPRLQPHQEKLMDPEVSDGWTKFVECELKADGLFYKIGEERADGLPNKIVGKIAAGMTRKELVRNELMGSTANEEFERRITASWCGSRVAGWRIAVVKTSASLAEKARSLRRRLWFRWIRSGM